MNLTIPTQFHAFALLCAVQAKTEMHCTIFQKIGQINDGEDCDDVHVMIKMRGRLWR